MTYFISWAHKGNYVSHIKHKEKVERGGGGGVREEVEQIENVEIKKKSWQWAKHVGLYSGLLQALKGEPLTALGSQQRRQFLRPQYPTVGYVVYTNIIFPSAAGGVTIDTDSDRYLCQHNTYTADSSQKDLCFLTALSPIC